MADTRRHRATRRDNLSCSMPCKATPGDVPRRSGGALLISGSRQSRQNGFEDSLLDLSVSTDTGPAPRLVLAPACQSATVDVRRLPDEFVGLPTGFLVSGVATFVGTLWPTGDVPTALMTMRIIELMFPRDPSAKALPPARALQQARAWLRDLPAPNSRSSRRTTRPCRKGRAPSWPSRPATRPSGHTRRRRLGLPTC